MKGERFSRLETQTPAPIEPAHTPFRRKLETTPTQLPSADQAVGSTRDARILAGIDEAERQQKMEGARRRISEARSRLVVPGLLLAFALLPLITGTALGRRGLLLSLLAGLAVYWIRRRTP